MPFILLPRPQTKLSMWFGFPKRCTRCKKCTSGMGLKSFSPCDVYCSSYIINWHWVYISTPWAWQVWVVPEGDVLTVYVSEPPGFLTTICTLVNSPGWWKKTSGGRHKCWAKNFIWFFCINAYLSINEAGWLFHWVQCPGSFYPKGRVYVKSKSSFPSLSTGEGQTILGTSIQKFSSQAH